ncbi:MAG: hypothetical protein ACM3N5_16125, partial [Candidatus Eiseniibacteriota bacterium]
YPCFTCADVDLARKNIDPSTPHQSPAVQAARDPSKAAANDATDPTKPGASVRAGADAPSKVEPPKGVNDPLAAGDRGTILNLLV